MKQNIEIIKSKKLAVLLIVFQRLSDVLSLLYTASITAALVLTGGGS